MKKIYLRKGKSAAVKRFHPWVFSGAVAKKEGDPVDGDPVEVVDYQNKLLGSGHFQEGSISVRMLSFTSATIDQDHWVKKIGEAYAYRQRLGLTDSHKTNCYRLVHAAGDQLPGLIIDMYGSTAVIQCHSIGMHRERDLISQALQTIFGARLTAIFDKSENTLPSIYAAGVDNGYLFGSATTAEVLEYGHKFVIDWEAGQKTGFFLDQRENRHLLSRYATEKRILNAFCYSGGFSVYALAAGAALVDSVDISQGAIDLTNQNIALNEFGESAGIHHSFKADVLDYLGETEQTYDIIILDPPAFAKSLRKRHKAVQAYKRLNSVALKKIPPGGMLFTFSCSKVVDRKLFRNTIMAAALESGRQLRLVHELGQPADHPVNFFHPEGEYLKGLVLYVD